MLGCELNHETAGALDYDGRARTFTNTNGRTMDRRIRCVIMRGGTSKAVFFDAQHLPDDPARRDSVILAAFGSPDIRQIDGLGGADPLTSKLAIVSPSMRADADIDYTFGQVGIATPSINYRVNCGNTAAAVGVYAVEEGIVPFAEGVTHVRIFTTNSGKHVVAEVPTANGRVMTEGSYRVSGVPRPGAEIRLRFLDPAGGVTGQLLPTGRTIDEVVVGGRRVELSVVDCGNLYAFIRADIWSLHGCELPADIEARPGFKAEVEEIRAAVCRELLPGDLSGGSSAKLKVAIVAPPAAGSTMEGQRLERESMDIAARIINQEKVHKAFAVTGAICLGAAAAIPGTIVNRIAPLQAREAASLRIGHPQGVIEPLVGIARDGDTVRIRFVELGRTARRIMDGFVYVPEQA